MAADRDKTVKQLKAAHAAVGEAKASYDEATMVRREAIREAIDSGVLSQGAVARELGLTVSRVRQILGKI